MLINLFWLSAPKPLKVTIYIGLGWLVRCRCAFVLHDAVPEDAMFDPACASRS